MGHLAGLVAAETLWLGQLHPKLCPHAQHRQGHADDGHKEGQFDLPLLAVTHLVRPPLAPSTFHSPQTSSLSSSCHPNATVLILLYKEVGPHADHNWPGPRKIGRECRATGLKIRGANYRRGRWKEGLVRGKCGEGEEGSEVF